MKYEDRLYSQFYDMCALIGRSETIESAFRRMPTTWLWVIAASDASGDYITLLHRGQCLGVQYFD